MSFRQWRHGWSLSSIKPNDSGSQMNSIQEVARSFVVARSNGAVRLEPDEEVLDQVTRLVQMAV